MQRGEVDLCIVGADRVTANGDAANKIGTYLKALAARDNAVPFYVAIPHSTIDWRLADGAAIPIEERDPLEVTRVTGLTGAGTLATEIWAALQGVDYLRTHDVAALHDAVTMLHAIQNIK